MIRFNYRRVDSELVGDLEKLLLNGQSAALLGFRDVGKRYVLRRLLKQLRTDLTQPIVVIDLLRPTPVTTEREIQEIVLNSVKEAMPQVVLAPPFNSGLLEAIASACRSLSKPLILMIGNVDSPAHHQSRRLLQEVRTLVEERKVVVVLSGEENVCELVHGPNSEFNCANQFVLQGFARDEFETYLKNRLDLIRLQFDEPEMATDKLFDLTGGNIHLFRAVLGALIEAAARFETTRDINEDFVVRVEELDGLPEKILARNSCGTMIFHYANRIIEREASTWDSLRALLARNTCLITQPHPHPLELAGMCVRENQELRFASPLMEYFAKRHYDLRRWGDLYAEHGLWPKAFECYSRLEPDSRVRPVGVDDRPDVAFAVKAFCSTLYLEATKGEQNLAKLRRLKRLFAVGCQQILGFPSVTFWILRRKWEPLDNTPELAEANVKASKMLATVDHRLPGYKEMSTDQTQGAVLAILPALRSDWRVAVILGDFERDSPISRERQKLVKDLVSNFVDAYSHAIAVVRDKIKLQERHQHLNIATSIFEAIGARVHDPKQALEMAARGLRPLGYRRLLFCLVDPVQRRIRGVLDSSDDLHLVDVARLTNYPLDEPLKDIQPYVVRTKRPFRVANAADEPLVNQDVVHQAGMIAFAVVPMLNPHGEVIGTIHVEREDNTVPSPEEAEDLMAFGKQLAVAVEQSERVKMLEETLDKFSEPVVIVDGLKQVRYANKPAHLLFDFPRGWHDQNDPVAFGKKKTQFLTGLVDSCLERKGRVFQHHEGVAEQTDSRVEVVVDAITDENEACLGAVVHVRYLDYLFRVFKAFNKVTDATDTGSAMRAMLEAAQLLGHKWGRLYRIDEENPDELVSDRGYGFGPAVETFDRHEVKLVRRSATLDESWVSLDTKQPTVFQWNPDKGNGVELTTAQGLPVTNVQNPGCPEIFNKKPGDYWMDFPLIACDAAVGKMTVECSANLRPEEFALLKVLCEMVNHWLGAMLQTESLKKEVWVKEVGERVIAVAAHHIGTRLAALYALAEGYEERERRLPELKALNEQLNRIAKRCQAAVDRVKHAFASPDLDVKNTNLDAMLRSMLRSRLPESAWELDCPADLHVSWDSGQFESAFLELVQNSVEIAERPEVLHLKVRVARTRRGRTDWVRLVYEDNGPGIPEVNKERIFEAFFSRRSPKRRSTGLGLNIVQRIVKAHGGTVRERGEVGHGAEFVLDLPKVAANGNHRTN